MNQSSGLIGQHGNIQTCLQTMTLIIFHTNSNVSAGLKIESIFQRHKDDKQNYSNVINSFLAKLHSMRFRVLINILCFLRKPL